MKKLLLAVVASLAMLLTSCNKESYYHSLGLVYPTGYQVAYLFADQTFDSLYFYSTDNTRLSAYNDTWVTIPDSMKNLTIPNYYRTIFYVWVPLTFEPNTTGKPRSAQVTIQSEGEDKWNQTTTATYYQLPWHNVYRPAPAFKYEDSTITGATFKATLKGEQISDTLEFYAYANWTLNDGTFVHPKVNAGGEGVQKVPLDVELNDSQAERTDQIVLTGKGVSTPIQFIQEIKKEEIAQ